MRENSIRKAGQVLQGQLPSVQCERVRHLGRRQICKVQYDLQDRMCSRHDAEKLHSTSVWGRKCVYLSAFIYSFLHVSSQSYSETLPSANNCE
jgi:hypothetical protein